MAVRNIAWGLVLVGLAACDTPRPTLSPNFGEAVRHNIAVQTINPTPNETLVAPDLDGERAVDSMNRYKKGQIKPATKLEAPSTTMDSGKDK